VVTGTEVGVESAGVGDDEICVEVSTSDTTTRPSWLFRVGVCAPFVTAAVAYSVFIGRSSFVLRGKRTFTLFDDAMISMTYARNLAHGRGLVWNAGGQRVEGVTNPLWTVMMAAVQFAGFGDNLSSLVVMLIGVACLLGTAVLARMIVRDLAPDAIVARQLVAWLILFDFALVFWTLRGMEVGLLTLLLFAAIYAAMKAVDGSRAAAWWVAALIVVGESTRLDFLVFGAVIFAYLTWRTTPAARARTLVIVGALPAAGVIVQELARRAYYGAWVPNTYTLKLGKIPLSTRLQRGSLVLEYGLLAEFGVVLVFALIGVLLACTGRVRAGLCLLGAVFVGSALYALSVGGDAWEWARFTDRYLTPGVAALMVSAAFGVQYLVDRLPVRRTMQAGRRPARTAWALLAALVGLVLLARWLRPNTIELSFGRRVAPGQAALVASVLVVGYLVVRRLVRVRASSLERGAVAALLGAALLVSAAYLPFLNWWHDGGVSVRDDAYHARYGAELGAITRPGARLAVTWAGAPIYFSHRTGIDILGKSDPRIAELTPAPHQNFYPGHNKYDLDISIFHDRPDVVAQYWRVNKDLARRILAAGYALMHPKADADPDNTAKNRPEDIMVLKSSPYVDWNTLAPSDVNSFLRRLPA
jgi:hypothetical protein